MKSGLIENLYKKYINFLLEVRTYHPLRGNPSLQFVY